MFLVAAKDTRRDRAKSTFQKPGPLMLFRWCVPNFPAAGCPNAAGFKKLVRVFAVHVVGNLNTARESRAGLRRGDRDTWEDGAAFIADAAIELRGGLRPGGRGGQKDNDRTDRDFPRETPHSDPPWSCWRAYPERSRGRRAAVW